MYNKTLPTKAWPIGNEKTQDHTMARAHQAALEDPVPFLFWVPHLHSFASHNSQPSPLVSTSLKLQRGYNLGPLLLPKFLIFQFWNSPIIHFFCSVPSLPQTVRLNHTFEQIGVITLSKNTVASGLWWCSAILLCPLVNYPCGGKATAMILIL